MENILPDLSKPHLIKIKMPVYWQKNECDTVLSFNGMHTTYNNKNADVLFSSFAEGILHENSYEKK